MQGALREVAGRVAGQLVVRAAATAREEEPLEEVAARRAVGG